MAVTLGVSGVTIKEVLLLNLELIYYWKYQLMWQGKYEQNQRRGRPCR